MREPKKLLGLTRLQNDVIKWLQGNRLNKEKEMKEQIITTLKEIARLVVFSLPGALILLLTNSPELAGIFGVPILYILRAVDKGIHDNPEVKSNGLVPF